MANVEMFHKHRIHRKIPFSEVEPLLNLARNTTGSTEGEVMLAIGYAGNSASDWRRTNEAPMRAKYTLLGFLAELKVKVEIPTPIQRQFDLDELATIFATFLASNKVKENAKLVAKIASEMQKCAME